MKGTVSKALKFPGFLQGIGWI